MLILNSQEYTYLSQYHSMYSNFSIVIYGKAIDIYKTITFVCCKPPSHHHAHHVKRSSLQHTVTYSSIYKLNNGFLPYQIWWAVLLVPLKILMLMWVHLYHEISWVALVSSLCPPIQRIFKQEHFISTNHLFLLMLLCAIIGNAIVKQIIAFI